MGLPKAGGSLAAAEESSSATELCDWYATGTDRYRCSAASRLSRIAGTITYHRRRSTAPISRMLTNTPAG